MKKTIQGFNQRLLSLVEHIGLLVIAVATVVALARYLVLDVKGMEG